MTKPEIQSRLTELKGVRAGRVELTQDYVLLNLTEIVERCMQRAPVMVREGREMVQAQDEEGNHLWEFNAKAALGGLDLIGKHLGMFKGAGDGAKRTGLDGMVEAMARRRAERALQREQEE